MKKITEILAKNLREIREKKGLSQEAMGALAGVSGQSIAAWEKQKRWPDVAQVTALSDALKIPESALFSDNIEVVQLPPPPLKELLLTLAALDDDEIRSILADARAATTARRGPSELVTAPAKRSPKG